jgi:acetyl-CoA hydrolase
MFTASSIPRFTAEEAAALINDGSTLACSGYAAIGAAKAVPRALAERIRAARQRGEQLSVRTCAGLKIGEADDSQSHREGALWSDEHASDAETFGQVRPGFINAAEAEALTRAGWLPASPAGGLPRQIDFAVVEAIDAVRDGRIYLTTSSGATPAILARARKILIEINQSQSCRLTDMHDVAAAPEPPYRVHIPIQEPLDRIGAPYALVDAKKIVGIVETDEPEETPKFDAPDEISAQIADHIATFLHHEVQLGALPPDLLPMQIGAGSLANAVASQLGSIHELPPLVMYGDVLPDALIDLMEDGRVRGASATSLTLSHGKLRHVFANMDFYAPRIVLRPQSISRNQAVLQRLGIIAINAALEIDVHGCANATRTWCGRAGAGPADDFVRNAYLSFLVMPSVARGDCISAIVPRVSHVDYPGRSIQVLVTEQGVADLRGLDPAERAEAIVENCAHPMYRDYLRSYIDETSLRRQAADFGRCFELYRNLMTTGRMLASARGA